jgi:hypothetical protein
LSGRQVVGAEVYVDEEVVVGERPALPLLGDERDTAGVHDADLDVGMRLAVLGGHPAAFGPAVAMGAAFQADLAAFEVLARPSPGE